MLVDFSDHTLVGIVAKPHGYNGSFAIKAIEGADAEMLMWDTLLVMIDGGLVPFTVEDVRQKNDSEVLVKLRYVDNETQARKLGGCEVHILRRWLDKDYEGAESDQQDDQLFHVAQLIGYSIINADTDQPEGEIADVDLTVAQNPLFVLSSGALVPIVEDWIVELNHGRRTITMSIPQGLL